MTIPVPHLVGCYKMSRADPSRYTCNCGADSQNERAAMLDRVEASDAAVHSHRVGDASPETAATTERTFPRVTLGSVAPGSLIEIASGDIGIALAAHASVLHRPVLWIATAHEGPLPASITVSLRATPAELDALTSADGASRPTLTEEQERAWAESIGDMIEAHGLDISIIAAALHRASRGETGPASAPPLAVEARFRATAKGAGLPADAIDRIVAGMRPQAPAPTKPGAQ